MACEQGIMDQESAYMAALERTSNYLFDAGRLVLKDDSGATQAELTR